MDVPGNSLDTGSAIPDDTSISVNPVGPTTIAIVNAGFETDVGPGFSTEVSAWNEGADSYVTSDAAFYGWSGAGRVLYLDSGGWVDQNVNYNWTAGEVFTLGIKGHQGWRPGGAFKIQLRQADGTVLWDSGTTPVAATVGNFRWSIDASTFSGAGVVPGSQLNLRIECLSATAYLDDVTLSTSLTDTTAPTLASADIVDNKSGGPVNPGQLVTYSVTFSEAMNSGTVSSSDFDNGGTAAVLIGTPTTTDGIQYQIPVVATGTGTLQLRVPAGATMTDLADIPLDTGSAILDDTTIDVVAKPIDVTGGDFESPTVTSQTKDISKWFNNNYQYSNWHQPAINDFGTSNGTQCATLLRQAGSQYGYIYQSLGQLEAGATSLDWSFDHVRYALLTTATGTAEMRFFYGVSLAAGEGVDIDTLGFTQIGGTISIPGVTTSDAHLSGSVDVSSVPAGATIWVDVTYAGTVNDSQEFMLDNIVVLVDTPTTGYTAWQATNGATGQTLDQDHDNDGVPNGIEYFLGGNTNTTGFTPLPGVSNSDGSLSVTWVRHPDYPGFPGNYGTDFVVETSATLTGPWTEESSPGNVTITGNDVTYTFPTPLGSKNFARLKVTGP